jgi:outer membrane receptor for ferric coprogen and ferric-rhodotorulic acid
LFGASWSKRTSDINTVSSPVSVAVDMFNPGASIVNEPNRPAWTLQDRITDIRYGVYGNTRLQLAEPLHLLIGTRLSWFDRETKSRVTDLKTNGSTQSAQLTPYAALT